VPSAPSGIPGWTQVAAKLSKIKFYATAFYQLIKAGLIECDLAKENSVRLQTGAGHDWT